MSFRYLSPPGIINMKAIQTIETGKLRFAESTPLAEPVPMRLINRDISLLEFFRNVLDEAFDATTPVLERLKFIAINASNLDEFFMIRVASLKEKLGVRDGVWPDGYSQAELLSEIHEKALALNVAQSVCLKREILPELYRNGIAILEYSELTDTQREKLDEYFHKCVAPILTPQAVDPTHPFPYISGGSLNIGVFITPDLQKRVAKRFGAFGDEFFVRVKIPSSLSRLIPVGDDESKFVFVEDIIRTNLYKLAPNATEDKCHFFRLTRDADIDLREAEAQDLLETMEENLKDRRFGEVSRLEHSESMPAKMVEYLTESLGIGADDVYPIDGPLNLADFWEIVGLNRPDLKATPIRVRQHEGIADGESIFDVIKRGDVLLHHPYLPYSVVTDMISEAAEDPDVMAIKMCLYRIGSDSPIAPQLIKAAENGKQVTALIEIKARFDEANNIEWGKKLEEAGVHVVYGLLGLKTHAKTTLIVRREGDELQRYVHVATGNYNPATSTVYTDLGLLTADADIGADVHALFNYLTVYTEPESISTLLIAPLNLRERMMEMIEREALHARSGRKARIIAKFNRLADIDIVNALYAASEAGVEIDLIVRGICTLRPGVPGLSENIRVRSIVGRLLEHSRVYFFENGGDSEVYIGSSDWMPRNLDRRVEVITPIKDTKIRNYLKGEYLGAYLKDNVKARELQTDGSYARVESEGEQFDSQLHFQTRNNVLELKTNG
jgi:polyphosphate kinase